MPLLRRTWGWTMPQPPTSSQPFCRTAHVAFNGLEVVPLGLDLGTELDLIPKRLEHGLDLTPNLRQDVDMSSHERRARKGDVDRLGLSKIGETRCFELGAHGRERSLNRSLGLVDRLAQRRLLFGAQLADAFEELADAPSLAPEVLDLDPLELLLGLRLADRGQGLAGQRGRVTHAVRLLRISNRISAAAAATLSDSTPSVSGTVTSFKSWRESPCASLPRTTMPADSSGASASGAPPDGEAP